MVGSNGQQLGPSSWLGVLDLSWIGAEGCPWLLRLWRPPASPLSPYDPLCGPLSCVLPTGHPRTSLLSPATANPVSLVSLTNLFPPCARLQSIDPVWAPLG